MSAVEDFAGVGPYSVAGPADPVTPVLFNSPHSGRHYPDRFRAMSRLDPMQLRRSEDAFVDELFSGAASAGAMLLKAHFPRAYLDANREAGELDPRLFLEPLPAGANTRSPRVAGGLGAIPRLVGEGAEIYPGRIPLAEARSRIETLYRPYHETLRGLVEQTHARFGLAVLIDCHSMPGSVRAGGEAFRPDFIVGDRFGRSASSVVRDAAIGLLTGMGYRVAHNKPYAGGYITDHYGRPARAIHALQIEVSRALYMDETAITKTAGFDALKRDIDRFVARFVAMADEFGCETRLAAE